MNKIKSILMELFDLGMRFPLFALCGLLLILGIVGLFVNGSLAIGSFTFALVFFIGQILVNKG